MSDYRTIIGLEVHVELATKTKTFCSCANDGIGAMPNTLTCPVCLGLPGAVPSVNRRAIELTIMAGLLLNAKISNRIMFERKTFDSVDMPKGYQLCQFTRPIGVGGQVVLKNGKKVVFNRIHLEEDAGKLIHKEDITLIDYNRSGAPILELVTEPMEMSTEEVLEFLDTLRHILAIGGISECRMEVGEFRYDVNMSVSKTDALGTRIELKNLTSTNALIGAIAYERERQISALENGETLSPETRIWVEEFGKTYVVRAKEDVSDYRHFPDPDLSVIAISREDVNRLKAELPESYQSRVNRYKARGFEDRQIEILTSSKAISDFMDETCKYTSHKEEVYNWLSGEMLRVHRNMNRQDFASIISPKELAQIVNMVMLGDITRTNAKELFDEVVETGRSVATIVKEQEMVGVVTSEEIGQILTQILSDNPSLVDDYVADKNSVSNHIIGLVKDITNGKALAKDILSVLDDMFDANEE